MPMYNKLIRDRIPEVIEADGRRAHVRILDAIEYRDALRVKLQEELQEFLTASASEELEELADLVEVIHAIVRERGFALSELERVREAKLQKRGGFAKRLFLVETID